MSAHLDAPFHEIRDGNYASSLMHSILEPVYLACSSHFHYTGWTFGTWPIYRDIFTGDWLTRLVKGTVYRTNAKLTWGITGRNIFGPLSCLVCLVSYNRNESTTKYWKKEFVDFIGTMSSLSNNYFRKEFKTNPLRFPQILGLLLH